MMSTNGSCLCPAVLPIFFSDPVFSGCSDMVATPEFRTLVRAWRAFSRKPGRRAVPSRPKEVQESTI
eukprot:6463685-Amphidinium_carterae.1